MFRLLKKVIILIMSPPLTWGYCLFFKNQECTVRKVIIDNDYRLFLIKLVLIDVLEVVIVKIFLTIKFVYQIVLKILV